MKIKSIRIHCITGAITEPLQTVEIRKGWFYLIPGVTGYESVAALDLVRDDKFCGWNACAGTPNSWDRLYIPEEEVNKLRLVASLMVALRHDKALEG